jgi:hypothetical protein
LAQREIRPRAVTQEVSPQGEVPEIVHFDARQVEQIRTPIGAPEFHARSQSVVPRNFCSNGGIYRSIRRGELGDRRIEFLFESNSGVRDFRAQLFLRKLR